MTEGIAIWKPDNLRISKKYRQMENHAFEIYIYIYIHQLWNCNET